MNASVLSQKYDQKIVRTSPFEKGGLRGIYSYAQCEIPRGKIPLCKRPPVINSHVPPFFKGGNNRGDCAINSTNFLARTLEWFEHRRHTGPSTVLRINSNRHPGDEIQCSGLYDVSVYL